MDASELLRRAADYIAEHGWLRGDFGHRGGPCCAIGAINAVAPPPTASTEWDAEVRGTEVAVKVDTFPASGVRFHAVRQLYDHLGLDAPWKDGFGIGNAVAQWNDDSRMTAHEVTAAMRAAADG